MLFQIDRNKFQFLRFTFSVPEIREKKCYLEFCFQKFSGIGFDKREKTKILRSHYL